MKPIDYIVLTCIVLCLAIGITLGASFPITYSYDLPDGKNIVTTENTTLTIDGVDYEYSQRNIPLQLTIGCVLVALGGGAGLGYVLGYAREG